MSKFLLGQKDTEMTDFFEDEFDGFNDKLKDIVSETQLKKLRVKVLNVMQSSEEITLIDGCSVIVSSPYTRCLQTAAIVSRIRNIPLKVEVDLHEWIPDLLFQNKAGEAKAYIGFKTNNQVKEDKVCRRL